MSDVTDIILPYAGTSGWSGSETSRKRAIDSDTDGTTISRQRATYEWLAQNRFFGMTWRDLSNRTGWHHGNASGVLSVLHKANVIVRLQERRHGSAVYVLPEFVNGRAISPHKQRGMTKHQLGKAIQAIAKSNLDDGECLDQILILVAKEIGNADE